MTLNPTQLTLRHLRNQGWTAEVVEHWVPGANIRRDLFGFVDVLAIKGTDTLAVQTTSAGNVSARVRKIADAPTVTAVREAGWIIHVHGWRKHKNRWELREVDVS
jgi:carbonic anhydrase